MSESEFIAAASRLCTACGMCCNGVLFHIVQVQPADSVRQLEKLGMKLNRKKTEPYFNQPCRFLHDCTCGIYHDRPTRCRLYECRQIKGLRQEEITELKAAEIIAEVQHQVRRVERMLEKQGPTDLRKPLIERCRDLLLTLDTGDPVAEAILKDMRHLNDLLNGYFRIEATPLDL